MALTHLPIVALVAIGVLVVGRIMALGRRGVRAVVVDRQRTAGEQAFEAAAAALLTWWVYLAVEYANGRGPRWMPGWLDRRLFGAPAGGALGTAILAAGVLLFAAALWSMGDAWRMGIDRAAHRGGAGGQRAHLVTAGVFARSRNPIYLAFDLVLLGSVLVRPRRHSAYSRRTGRGVSYPDPPRGAILERGARRGLCRLSAANSPVFLAPGRWPAAQWPAAALPFDVDLPRCAAMLGLYLKVRDRPPFRWNSKPDHSTFESARSPQLAASAEA